MLHKKLWREIINNEMKNSQASSFPFYIFVSKYLNINTMFQKKRKNIEEENIKKSWGSFYYIFQIMI